MNPDTIKVPDVFELVLGTTYCYIFKQNGKFVGQFAERCSEGMSTPGECLNWIIRAYNNHTDFHGRPNAKELDKVKILDISEIGNINEIETE